MAPPPIIEERNQDGHRAKVRIGVAAALLVTAIGILTALNHRRTEPAAEESHAGQAVEQASLSSEDMEAPAAIPEDAVPATPPPQPAEDTTMAPPPPIPGRLPDISAAPSGKATTAPVLEEESAGASTAMPYVASAAKTLGKPEMSVAAVQSPAANQAPSAPPPIRTSVPVAPAPKAFEVQLGVFTDIDNARQLQSRLAQHGIPSHTETRVQIGPFKSRAEADRAREKLKSLGITAVILGKQDR